MKTLRTIGLLVVLAAMLLPGLALLAPSTASAEQSTRDWLQMMDARYDKYIGQPGEVTRGTGFKPYERYKWFVQDRLDSETGSEIPGCRWEAWKEMRKLEQQFGTRSQTWFSLGPINVAGRCLAIKVDPTDPNTVYAGFASSGLWKTTNAGVTWAALGDTLPTLAISAIKIDPSNPNRIWIGTGEGWGNVDAVHGVGLMVSTDAGLSFQLTGYNYAMSSGRDVYEVEYNPTTGTLMVAADNGLWRSTDDGVTFTRVSVIGTWTDVKLKVGSSSIMFATMHGAAGAGFYKSIDDGLNWTLTTNGTPATGIANNRFSLTAIDPETIFWAISDGGGATLGIYKSSDGGDSFSLVSTANHYGNQGWYNLTISIDPNNVNNIFSGGVNFYRSGNGGASFFQTATNVHVDHHATAWSPSNPTQFWVGSDGGVWRSTNSGSSFIDCNTGLTTLQFYAINQGTNLPTRAMGGTQDNGTYLYNNNLNWDHVIGGDGFFTEIDRAKPDTLYGELYYGDHRRSFNGGATFVPINGGISEQGQWSTPTWMDYSNSSILWTAHNTRICRTTNNGSSWTWMNNPAGLGGGRSIHQCKAHPEVLAVISGSKVFLTTDSGTTWVERTSGLVSGNQMRDIYIHPTDPNIMVLTIGSYSTSTYRQVNKTTDQGLSWFPIDVGLPNEPVNTIEMDPSHPDWYFIGTDLGVYVSFDGGTNWQPFNTGLPHVVVSDLRLNDSARLLRAGTHGRGMWEVDISGLDPVSVKDPRPTVQPLTLRIFGNPASTSTNIRYGIRQPGQVKLGIYDLQGRLVKSVRDGFEYPMVNSVDVDLKDLPGGVYFARLAANGTEISQKLVVQK